MMLAFIANFIIANLLAQPFNPSSLTQINFSSPPNQSVSLALQNFPQRKNSVSLGIKTTAESILAVDEASGQILFAKNPQKVLPIASITKLMTALVFLENNPGWEKEIIITEADQANGGRIYLGKGEKITARDLFYSALVGSDNQASLALARATGLPRQNFVQAMNEKAKEFGMEKTQFTEPTGLDPANVSTATDLIKLINQALNNQEIKKALTTKSYTYTVINKSQHQLTMINTDRLLDSFLNNATSGYQIIGAKTGSLGEAGYCFVAKIQKDNHPIIIASLGSVSSADRFQEIKSLASWVFDNYHWTEKNN